MNLGSIEPPKHPLARDLNTIQYDVLITCVNFVSQINPRLVYRASSVHNISNSGECIHRGGTDCMRVPMLPTVKNLCNLQNMLYSISTMGRFCILCLSLYASVCSHGLHT